MVPTPFDLRGPEFLVFYLVLSTITIVVSWALGRRFEAGQPGAAGTVAMGLANQPYEIAFLQGGRDEAIRVAVLSLIERGLLDAHGERLVVASADAAVGVTAPLDKAILGRFATEGPASDLRIDSMALDEADLLGERLAEMQALPDDRIRAARRVRAGLAVGLLWLVAGTKMVIAFSRGRTNVEFLILLAGLDAFILLWMARPARTALGQAVPDELGLLFSNLRDRRDSFELSRTSHELTYLAAVFGTTALPLAVSGLFHTLELRPRKSVNWGGDASMISSCSAGSSCGGGGGCGGCGS